MDVGTEIFVWVGKGASKEERSNALGMAAEYLKESGKPTYTPVTKVMETGEPQNFKCCFKNWPVARSPVLLKQAFLHNVARHHKMSLMRTKVVNKFN